MSDRDLTSGVDSLRVHIGLWTNWAQGKIYGATLTTTKQNGNLLIAFLALFVAAAGKSFWRLTCLVLHRTLSSRNPCDTLHHQQQVILRNSETPEFALWNFILMLRAWMKKATRPISRLLLHIILSFAIFAAYNVASLFSSRVTNATASEVLLTGKDCRAPWKPDDMDGTRFRTMYDIWDSHQNTAVLNYAQKCYMNLGNEEDCQYYVKSKVDIHITRNTSCPFDDKMCRAGGVIMDTGHINSNTGLGINMPPSSQFTFRSVNRCAPIVSEGYTYILNQTRSPIRLIRYQYGNYTSLVDGSQATKDFVYQVAANNISYTHYEDSDLQVRRNARYDVKPISYLSGNVTQSANVKTITLIPELSISEADIHLHFLSSKGLFYLAEINDPWYAAHRNISLTIISSEDPASGAPISHSVPFYIQDDPASVMACKAQYQICNPSARHCSRLAGLNDLHDSFADLWATESASRQKFMEWVYFLLRHGYIAADAIVDSAGQAALTAAYSLRHSVNGPLSDTAWEDDVFLWNSAATASLQALFVNVAAGPSQYFSAGISTAPKTPEARTLCSSQRIRSPRHTSFSVLGLALIFALGGALIVLDLGLAPLLHYLQRNNDKHAYARLEWSSNATLQLHRLAHEAAASGTWAHATHTVPTTRPGDVLRTLNIADIMHPRLEPGSYAGRSVQVVDSLERAFALRPAVEQKKLPGFVARQESVETLALAAGRTESLAKEEPLRSPLRREFMRVDGHEENAPSPVPLEVETAYGQARS